MSYEENFTGKTFRVSTDIVNSAIYPPDYFLKKAISKVKDAAKDVVKLAPKIASPATALIMPKSNTSTSFGKVADKVLKVTGTASGAVTTAALGNAAVKKLQEKQEIKNIDKKLQLGMPQTSITEKVLTGLGASPAIPSSLPKVDLVSSVTGAQGTPLLGAANTVREKLQNIGEKIPKPLQEIIKQKGQEAINKGYSKLTPSQQAIAEGLTDVSRLPKTKAIKDAENAMTIPTPLIGSANTVAGIPTNWIIYGIASIIVIVVLGLIFKK
jgi:hypothetical protein